MEAGWFGIVEYVQCTMLEITCGYYKNSYGAQVLSSRRNTWLRPFDATCSHLPSTSITSSTKAIFLHCISPQRSRRSSLERSVCTILL